MARAVQDVTRRLIADGGFDRVWAADLLYDGARRMANVPIADPSFSWDGGAQIVGSGSCRVVWNDDHATTMIPRRIGDWFAPFGAELQVDLIVSSGSHAERVPMGRFVLESVPNARESEFLWRDQTLYVGESFGLSLKDPMIRVARDKFPFPTSPRSTSAWAEAQAITGMPIIRNVPDATVPTTVTYDDDRAKSLGELFDLMGAWPALTPAGVLTARPKAWGSPVGDLTGVVSAPRTLTAERTYNRVVVKGKSPAGDPIYGIAEITEGFLRVRNADGSRSPFGVATYEYASDFLTTEAMCLAYARELLPRVSKVRGVVRDVEMTLNPLWEVGDVLRFDGGIVRVASISHSEAITKMTVEVPDD